MENSKSELLCFMQKVRPAVKQAHTKAYSNLVDLQLGKFPAHYESMFVYEEKLWGDLLDEIDAKTNSEDCKRD